MRLMFEAHSYAHALQLFQQGQARQAHEICQLLTRRQPRDAEAWHLMGLIAYQAGDLANASAALSQAVQLQPGQAHFQVNLAHALLDQGQARQAARHYEKALKKLDSPQLRSWLAVALERSAQVPKARQCLRQGLQKYPQDPGLFQHLGQLEQNQQALPEALAAYQQALKLAPGNAQILLNLGFVLQQLERLDEAFAHYQKALEIKPDYAQAAYNLGLLFEARGDWVQAGSCYARTLQIDPGFVLAVLNWSHLLMQQNPLQAIELLTQALQLPQNQADAELWLQLSNLYRQTHQLAAAQEACEAVLARHPGHPGAYFNLGNLALQQGKLSEARAAYQQTLQQIQADTAQTLPVSPAQKAQVRYAVACMHLLEGDLLQGWPDYAARWQLPHAEIPRAPALPEWQGEDLQHRAIWVYGEQGFGDQIQFLRYLPLLRKSRQPRALYFAVSPPLLRLAQALALDCDAVFALQAEAAFDASWAQDAGLPWPPADCRVPLLSLPHFLQTTLETIPPCADGLRLPDTPALPPTPGLRRIGWVWAAGQAKDPEGFRAYQTKSFAPELLQRFADLPRTCSYALQIGPDQLTPTALSGDFAWLQDLSPRMQDFLDTAVILQQLDLVITVDTAVAHLAGSLGRPTWLLLPCVPDWRWLLERPDSPWYPGMRLFRQPRPGDWVAVLDAVAEALQA